MYRKIMLLSIISFTYYWHQSAALWTNVAKYCVILTMTWTATTTHKLFISLWAIRLAVGCRAFRRMHLLVLIAAVLFSAAAQITDRCTTKVCCYPGNAKWLVAWKNKTDSDAKSDSQLPPAEDSSGIFWVRGAQKIDGLSNPSCMKLCLFAWLSYTNGLAILVYFTYSN